MANQPITTTAPISPIQQLAPRLAGVRTAIEGMAPLMESLAGRPTPLYSGMQVVFDGLCDEAWAIQTVILALPPTGAEDLHVQASIARDYMADHLPQMPLLEQFIERVEAYAA